MKSLKLSEIDLLSIGNTVQLVGAVYQGGGRAFLCYFPEDAGDALDADAFERLNMDQADWQKFLRQADLLEVEILSRKPSDAGVTKAIVRKSARQIEQQAQWNVWRRDKLRCRYCGNDRVPLTVDHLVCWEEGGPSTEDNMVAACRKCNKVRGNLPYADWLRHPYYLERSRGLDEATREANEAVAATLAAIPRAPRIKSR